MRYPMSEALDRYSILWLKRFFGCEVDAEFEAIENYVRDELQENWQLVRQSIQLGTCNALQWMLEECVSPFEDDECVAEAALRIRKSNVQRVAAKNGLAELLGGGFQDQRVRYPGSEILSHGVNAYFDRTVRKLEEDIAAGEFTVGGLDYLVDPSLPEDPDGTGGPPLGYSGDDGTVQKPASDLPKFACDDPEGAEYER